MCDANQKGLCLDERLQPCPHALDPRGSRRYVGGRGSSRLHARCLQQGGAGSCRVGRSGLRDGPVSAGARPHVRGHAGWTPGRDDSPGNDRGLRAAGGHAVWHVRPAERLAAQLGDPLLDHRRADRRGHGRAHPRLHRRFHRLDLPDHGRGLRRPVAVRLHHEEGPDRLRQLPDRGPVRPDHRQHREHLPAELDDAVHHQPAGRVHLRGPDRLRHPASENDLLRAGR